MTLFRRILGALMPALLIIFVAFAMPVGATPHPLGTTYTCHITATGFGAGCTDQAFAGETMGFHNTHISDLRVTVNGPSGSFDECVEAGTYSDVDSNMATPVPGVYEFQNSQRHQIDVYAGCVPCPCPPIFSKAVNEQET